MTIVCGQFNFNNLWKYSRFKASTSVMCKNILIYSEVRKAINGMKASDL